MFLLKYFPFLKQPSIFRAPPFHEESLKSLLGKISVTHLPPPPSNYVMLTYVLMS